MYCFVNIDTAMKMTEYHSFKNKIGINYTENVSLNNKLYKKLQEARVVQVP